RLRRGSRRWFGRRFRRGRQRLRTRPVNLDGANGVVGEMVVGNPDVAFVGPFIPPTIQYAKGAVEEGVVVADHDHRMLTVFPGGSGIGGGGTPDQARGVKALRDGETEDDGVTLSEGLLHAFDAHPAINDVGG